MFDDIRGDLRNKTRISYIFAGTATIITLLCIWVPQLQSLYGANSGDRLSIFVRFTIPFEQGFDNISAVFHLLFNLFFLWIYGTYVEKIIGSFRYLLLLLVLYLLYVSAHRILFMIGDGLTPLITGLSGFMVIIMLEAKFVQTRSVFDSYYRLLVVCQIIIWGVLPILMMFIPIYYDSKLDLIGRIFYGNILHFITGFAGILLAIFYKDHIRDKLKQRVRKKYIRHEQIDDYAYLMALAFPIYLIIVLLLYPS